MNRPQVRLSPAQATWVLVLITIVSLPVLVVAAFLYLIALAAAFPLLLVATWGIALVRGGPYILIVYSNSPRWQTYFEEQILPAVPPGTPVLNWSERRSWGWSLPIALFRVFGGHTNFNPLALIFRPFRWPGAIRFFSAFKYHRPDEVERLRRELLAVLQERDRAGRGVA